MCTHLLSFTHAYPEKNVCILYVFQFHLRRYGCTCVERKVCPCFDGNSKSGEKVRGRAKISCCFAAGLHCVKDTSRGQGHRQLVVVAVSALCVIGNPHLFMCSPVFVCVCVTELVIQYDMH